VSYLVLGFDPFPYLGQDNLPMSIFTVNVIDWFFALSNARGKATGEPIALSAAQPGDQVFTPAGERVILRPGATAFTQTIYQGIYQVVRQNARDIVAVNLGDVNESDLRQPAPIGVGGESDAKSSKSVLLPFWPHFLLAALLLLLIEWFINPRRALYGRSVATRRKHAV
jgi:hypothetical protein